MYVHEVFNCFYIARRYQTGRINVNLLVRRPDGVLEGLLPMTEYDPVNQKGIYKYDYTPHLVGEYLFTVYENGSWKHSKSEFFDVRPTQVPIAEFYRG